MPLKWRHYALNPHHLCVPISTSLITLLCLHISRATGNDFVRVTGAWRGKGKDRGWGGVAELILARATDFWEELDLSVSQLHLAKDTGDEAPGQHFLARTVQNKQVALDIFSLAGLSLAIGQK